MMKERRTPFDFSREHQEGFLKKGCCEHNGGEHGEKTEKMDTAPVDRSGQGNPGGKCLGRLQNHDAEK
jgi:hypothetical protein